METLRGQLAAAQTRIDKYQAELAALSQQFADHKVSSCWLRTHTSNFHIRAHFTHTHSLSRCSCAQEKRAREYGELQGRLNAALLATQMAEQERDRLQDALGTHSRDLVRESLSFLSPT